MLSLLVFAGQLVLEAAGRGEEAKRERSSRAEDGTVLSLLVFAGQLVLEAAGRGEEAKRGAQQQG